MENENTKKTAAQEGAGEKESGFNCCADCCEGMPIHGLQGRGSLRRRDGTYG